MVQCSRASPRRPVRRNRHVDLIDPDGEAGKRDVDAAGIGETGFERIAGEGRGDPGSGERGDTSPVRMGCSTGPMMRAKTLIVSPGRAGSSEVMIPRKS